MKGEENLLSVEQRTAVNSRRLRATAESRVMHVKCKDAFTADALSLSRVRARIPERGKRRSRRRRRTILDVDDDLRICLRSNLRKRCTSLFLQQDREPRRGASSRLDRYFYSHVRVPTE